jgi:hypothetical protein
MKVKISIAAIIPFIFMAGVLVDASYAQHPSPEVSSTVSPTESPSLTPSVTPTISSSAVPSEQRLGKIETALSEVTKKIENRPKDLWDKFNSISGLLSGIMIAVIGGIATYIYHEKQRSSEEALKKKELVISQAQVIQKLMPGLKSEDKREVKAALLCIAAIDTQLGTNLSELFGGEEGSEVLSKISSSPNVTQEQKVRAKASKRSIDTLMVMRHADLLRKRVTSDNDKLRTAVTEYARNLGFTKVEVDNILEQLGLQDSRRPKPNT